MNEQLQQLARQAGFCGTGFHNTLPGTTQEDALKNFAELIVRECAGVGYDASYYECALNVSNKILEHFGVKE